MTTESDLARRRLGLSPAKRALLEERLRGIFQGRPGANGIPHRRASARDQHGPIARSIGHPLSLAQQRLWFLDQLHPGGAVFNLPLAIRLEGRLDVAALEWGIDEILQRHEALRTTFARVDGQPVQVVREVDDFTLPVTWLAGLPDEQEIHFWLQTMEEARRPFDLEAGPLLRAKLLRRSEVEHVLLLTMHHLVADGWSMGVLFRELGALYAAVAAGRRSPLPELPIQYADFAVWQRERLAAGELDGQLAYWRERLAGAPAVLDLPTDRPRPPVQTFRGAGHHFDLPAPLTAALKELGRGQGATLYMTLLAAFQALLARYTGQDVLVVGSPIAGRTRVETEGLIGFFVNTLPLRVDLSGDPSFRELLGRARGAALGAFANQELPFERLVEALHPARSTSHAPLVQVLFVLQNTPSAPLALPGLILTRLDVDTGTAQFDLSLDMREADGALTGRFEYSTDLFDAGTIERMAGHFRTLLEGVVADPDRPLSTLPLLTEAERHRVVVEWNATDADYLADACLHDLFDAQVERAADALAVVAGGEALSYRKLDEQANRLAHHLRSLGVGPDVRVGLRVERSLDLAVGVLGILKAGGAYVPIDPSYPAARQSFMLADAAAPVLVTTAELADRPGGPRPLVVRLDADAAAIAVLPAARPEPVAGAGDLAYVIYTSGSTGTPKGVAMPHRPLVNLVAWQRRRSKLEPGARTLQFTSPSFDVSCHELFSTWAAGGTLVFAPEEARRDPALLARFLAEAGIARVYLPAAALQGLAEAIAAGAPLPTDLREVVSTAEQLRVTPALIDLFARLPDCVLDNQYGPTETHVVTAWSRSEGTAPWPPLPPIGRPIANARAYVLDGARQPVPVGVAGELYLGGVALARGYLDRPELTAERFVPDPFAAEPGGRLYRTGDRARRRADGNLEFLGRLDGQVKVRGFRVEPAEVEVALAAHPAVFEAAVAAREDRPGDQRLVAYVVPRGDDDPAPDELRRFLKATLPDHLVPSTYVTLDALPLTPSGKLDRAALPAQTVHRPELAAAYRPPRTPTETTVATIWADLLNVARVGIDDDFFDLGGHSLLVPQAAVRLRETLGVDVPPLAFFEAPTVAELAARIEAPRQEAAPTRPSSVTPLDPVVPLQPHGAGRPLFLVSGGRGGVDHLFMDARLARLVGTDRPTYGFLAGTPVEVPDAQTWVESLAADYARQVRIRQPEGPYVVAGICVGGVLAFELARRLVADGQRVSGLLLIDTWYPSKLADRVPGATRGGLLLRYRPHPYPGRMTLFVNAEWHAMDPTLGWAAVPTGGVDSRLLPGDHNLYREGRLELLAERLRDWLAEVNGGNEDWPS